MSSHATTLPKERLLQLLAATREANAGAYADACEAGKEHPDARYDFELREAILASVEASIANGNDAESALVMVRHLGVTLTGACLLMAHDGQRPCSTCFGETVEVVVDELATACAKQGHYALHRTATPSTRTKH